MKKVLFIVIMIVVILILEIYVSQKYVNKKYASQDFINQEFMNKNYLNQNCLNQRLNKENYNIGVDMNKNVSPNNIVIEDGESISEMESDDWRITLVNYENSLPDNFEIELASIDATRQFDKRAINELLTMIKDAKSVKVLDMWVQSAYRSIEYQRGLFNKKVSKYMAQGRSREEAEILTLQTINKPGTSEHNLGLAVDFNYVNYNFENTKAFKWLLENAENYGFILRYRKYKENITKVEYEPWHWRYVGVEHAKKINELDMCLEEYIEYLAK